MSLDFSLLICTCCLSTWQHVLLLSREC